MSLANSSNSDPRAIVAGDRVSSDLVFHCSNLGLRRVDVCSFPDLIHFDIIPVGTMTICPIVHPVFYQNRPERLVAGFAGN